MKISLGNKTTLIFNLILANARELATDHQGVDFGKTNRRRRVNRRTTCMDASRPYVNIAWQSQSLQL
jgi:hypothetical protein